MNTQRVSINTDFNSCFHPVPGHCPSVKAQFACTLACPCSVRPCAQCDTGRRGSHAWVDFSYIHVHCPDRPPRAPMGPGAHTTKIMKIIDFNFLYMGGSHLTQLRKFNKRFGSQLMVLRASWGPWFLMYAGPGAHPRRLPAAWG